MEFRRVLFRSNELWGYCMKLTTEIDNFVHRPGRLKALRPNLGPIMKTLAVKKRQQSSPHCCIVFRIHSMMNSATRVEWPKDPKRWRGEICILPHLPDDCSIRSCNDLYPQVHNLYRSRIGAELSQHARPFPKHN